MPMPDKGFREKLAELSQSSPPKPEPAPALPELEDVMVKLGDCAWCFAKPQFALDVEDGAKPVVSFQYLFLGIRVEHRPGSFTILFKDGLERWRVTVWGRNLRPIFNRINEHRIRRIRKADRDFGEEKEPLIIKIEIVELDEEGQPKQPVATGIDVEELMEGD
jgi:hypothetical protein